MKYKIGAPRFGKFFTVPCSAVENYIKVADGDFVKVLLCLLCSNSDIADTQTVADACGLKASAVEDAVLFWQNCGVISAEPCSEGAVNAVPAAAPAQAPVIQSGSEAKPVCLTDAINPMKNTAAAKSVVRYSPKDIAEKIKHNKDLQTMFDEIQRAFGRPVTGTESAGLINIYEYYGYDVPTIVMIAEFCQNMGKGKIAYIETIARDWFSRGICDFTQVEQEIIRQTAQNNYDSAAARVLGIEGRLTKKQCEYFAQWKEWGFDEKLIDLAGERCRDEKNKLNLAYTNGILKRWYENGIFTPEDVERSELIHQKEMAVKAADISADNSYDLNEWRSMAASFDPNSISFEEADDT